MSHYLGFVMAIWYWHFVDVVWIILFIFVYCWGNW
jgi:cytochrome c oxidase subunit 3